MLEKCQLGLNVMTQVTFQQECKHIYERRVNDHLAHSRDQRMVFFLFERHLSPVFLSMNHPTIFLSVILEEKVERKLVVFELLDHLACHELLVLGCVI